jgi:hypothetical protein
VKALKCFFAGHIVRYADLKRISDDEVEWPCFRCGRVLRASCGLQILHDATLVTAPDGERGEGGA